MTSTNKQQLKLEKQKQLEKVIDSHSLKYYGYFNIIFQLLIFLALVLSLIFSSISLYQNKRLYNYLDTNKTLQSTNAKTISNVTPYDTITDLTGTTWYINLSPNTSTVFIYDLNYFSNNVEFYEIRIGEDLNGDNDTNSISYYSNSGNILVYYEGQWNNQLYRNITFTGGTDATNSNLFNWLQSNATQIQSSVQLTTPILSIPNPTTEPTRLAWLNIPNATTYKIYKNGVDINYNGAFYSDGTYTYYVATEPGTYQVQAIGDNTNYTDSSLSNSITISSIQLNSPTISLNVANHTLSWSSVYHADGYKIYKNGSLLDTTNNTNYVLSSPYNGSYYVVAYSNSSSYTDSNNSNTITGYAVDFPQVTFDISTQTFTWSSVTNATAYEIYNNNTLVTTTNNTSYYINYNSGSYTFKALGDSTTYMDSGLTSPILLYALTTDYNYSNNSNIICENLSYNTIRFPYCVPNGSNLSMYFYISNQPNYYFITGNTYFDTLDNITKTETIISNIRLQVDLFNISNDIYFELTPTFSYVLEFDITDGILTEVKINDTFQTLSNIYYLSNSTDVIEFKITADNGYMFYNQPIYTYGTLSTFSDSTLTFRHYSITNIISSGDFYLVFDEQIHLTGQWAFIGSQNFSYNNLPFNATLNINFVSNGINFKSFNLDTTTQVLSYELVTPILLENSTILYNLSIFKYSYDINNNYFHFDYLNQTTANYYFIEFNDNNVYISSTEYYNIFTKYFRVATNQDYNNLGYNNGVIDANQYTMANLLFAIADTPIKIVRSLLNFNFFGVNLFGLASMIITLLCVWAVFHFLKGGKSDDKK